LNSWFGPTSRDPAFTAKVKDVVGLYLNPPDNAIVLSIDEKTSIHALDPRHARGHAWLRKNPRQRSK
jgi:hypothetical protein